MLQRRQPRVAKLEAAGIPPWSQATSGAIMSVGSAAVAASGAVKALGNAMSSFAIPGYVEPGDLAGGYGPHVRLEREREVGDWMRYNGAKYVWDGQHWILA